MDNLSRTFRRYDRDQDGLLSRSEVEILVEDLFEVSLYELASEEQWPDFLTKRTLGRIYSKSGQRIVSKVVDSIMEDSNDGEGMALSQFEVVMCPSKQLLLHTKATVHQRDVGAVKSQRQVVCRTTIDRTVRGMCNRPAYWTLAPLCSVELDVEFLRTDPWAKAKSFGIGCIAGIAAKTSASPFSRVTILMQTQHVRGATTEKELGLVRFMRHIVVRDGVAGLFRGNTADVLRAAPYTGINFLAYEFFKELSLPLDPTESKALCKFGSGGMSGVVGTLLTYPLDLLRTQTAVIEGGEVSLARQAKAVIASGGGVGGLWHGAGTAILQKFPQFAILFGVCENSRMWLRCRGHDNISAGVVSGIVGGAVASSAVFPLSLVLRTLQTESDKPPNARRYRGAWHVFSSVWKTSGIKGLFKGISPSLVQGIPACAVSYATYDALRGWLRLPAK